MRDFKKELETELKKTKNELKRQNNLIEDFISDALYNDPDDFEFYDMLDKLEYNLK